MKNSKWPTLEGRLRNAQTSELDALEQLSRNVELTDFAKKRRKKLRKRKQDSIYQ